MIRRSRISEASGQGLETGSKLSVMEDCPFCGSGNVKVDVTNGITFFLCDGCGAVVSFRAHENEETSTRLWNSRQSKRENPG